MQWKLYLVLSLLLLSKISHASGFMAVANIVKINGSATVKKANHIEKVKVGDEVVEGMNLSLAKSGDFVEVKFQNGHVLRFTGAEVKIEKLDPKNTLIDLIKGRIFSMIFPLTPNEKFAIKTKQASFAVRGTRFFIEESKTSSYLCVCEGVVSVKNDQGKVEVKKDEDLMVAPKKKLQVNPSSQVMTDMSNNVFREMGF